MFDKFVADLLTTHLGEYFDNIDRQQVKVSVWNGRVHLRNLKVRSDALRFLDVPICVLMGTIEELTVVIPWTHLRSESVVVKIRNAQLILSDKETARYDVGQEKREGHARKERELRAADEALLLAFKESLLAQSKSSVVAPAAETSTADNSDKNFTARLKASILNNIRVEVEHLFVKYTSSVATASHTDDDDEDSGGSNAATTISQNQRASLSTEISPLPANSNRSNKKKTSTRQASLSFQIEEMKTCGCNERFEPAFVNPGERMSRQLISFRGLAVSLRTGALKETEAPLLYPFNVAVELAYQPVVTDSSTPQYMLAFHMDESCTCVMTSESCTTCYELLCFLQYVRERQALRRLRPIGGRPSRQPQLWWRYVLDAVHQQVRHEKSVSLALAHKPTPFSWLTYTKAKAKRDRYMALYLRRQRAALGATRWLEPLNVDEHVEMIVLEEELPTEILKLAKQLAIERAIVERGEYEKLLRQKRVESAAAGDAAKTAATAAIVADAAREASKPAPASVSLGGWLSSFWRSTPQLVDTSFSGAIADGVPDDDLDDATRAELRESVQLMMADKWTEAQRAVIAREFGISAEEAKEFAQGGTGGGTAARETDVASSGSTANARQRPRAAPEWVVFVRAISVSLELRSSQAETRALREASQPSHDTLAKLLLENLRGGAEWGGSSNSGNSAETALPLAYYWGSIELLSITAAKLKNSGSSGSGGATQQAVPQQQGEQEILTVGHPQFARVVEAQTLSDPLQSTSPPAARKAPADAALRRARPFSPLEACWSILSDECRRTAAWQCEWTQRSPQQLTSHTSAVHRVRVRLAPLNLVVDVVPLRHLTDFFFTVMWPNTVEAVTDTHRGSAPALRERSTACETAPSPAPAVDSFTTALGMPIPHPLTRIEQRCATDPDARLIILRRKVERQHSVEWDVLMDCVTISVSEIPAVQGCELTIKQLALRNDIEHRLQRQERLQRDGSTEDGKSGMAVLGASDTDWLDYTRVEAASTSLCVFLPIETRSPAAPPSPSSPAQRAVLRHAILADTPFTAVVERSLLGRCYPEKSRYRLCISSSTAVHLSWSRSTLSVLATSCSMLSDLATSVGETLLQRGNSASATPEAAREQGSSTSTSTFHVNVLPHVTRTEFWKDLGATAEAAQQSAAAADGSINSPELFYKQMHPFSATRLAMSTGAATAAKTAAGSRPRRRVDIRHGVCVLYHPERLPFPAEYYALQTGCTRVRRTEEKTGVDGESPAYVHLYVSQGGVNHEEVLTDACDAAEQLLLRKVGVPPALLHNAVWLESAVHAWIADRSLRDDASGGDADNGTSSEASAAESDPFSVEQVQRALDMVVRRTHLVPCRYVAFECANVEEAQRMEAALLRCCVAPSTPPLELSPAVQAQYKSAVVAAPLRKQPVWSAQLDFPSLQMTCEGREPTVSCDVLQSTLGSQAERLARRDAVLSFVPFGLRYDRFAEKQRFELTVLQKMEMYACSPTPATDDADRSTTTPSAPAKHFLFEVAPRSASSTHTPSSISSQPSPSAPATASLFLRFVTYNRPHPLPPMKRCGISVGPASTLKILLGPVMLSWAEAWWDSFGLLTNRLFAEEVIEGYPWWPSLSSDEERQKSRATEEAWCGVEECGGHRTSTMVDLTAPAVEVELGLPLSATQPAQALEEEFVVLRFAARDTSLRWHLTEALNQMGAKVRNPALQWRPLLSVGAESSAAWVTVMDPTTAAPDGSAATLGVDFKLHKSPPMLSASDWLSSGVSAGGANDVGASAQHLLGFRDRQEMEVNVSGVSLLYWHPLLMHMMQSIQDGVLRRGVTVVNREPCWFHDGVLYCPPLTWPPRGLPLSTDISWERLRKSFVLKRVVLQMPSDVRWMEKVGRGTSVTRACEIEVARLTYTDSLRGEPAAATATACQRSYWESATHVHVIEFHGMSLRRCSGSIMLSPAFNAHFPSWSLTLALPLYQTSSVWKAKQAWHKTFHLCFAGSSSGQEEVQLKGDTATWRGTSADLAFVMNLMHANYVADHSTNTVYIDDTSANPSSKQPSQHPLATMGGDAADSSPATLLKAVIETSTLIVDVQSRFEAFILPGELQKSLCSVALGGARAVVDRCKAGELSCTLEVRCFTVGGGARPSSSIQGRGTKEAAILTHISFPATASRSSVTSPPLLRFQYGWRWTVGKAATAANSESEPDSTAERALYVSLDANDCIGVTADGAALAHIQAILQSPSLRDSISRFTSPVSSSPSPSSAPPSGWGKTVAKAQLAQLALQLPCATATAADLDAAASSEHDLRLCVLTSGVAIRLRTDTETRRGMLRVGKLMHCVLRDTRDAATGVLTIPLLLEQPSGWSQPTASSPRVSRQTRSSPQRATQTMETPKPTQSGILEELFGELPSSSAAASCPTAAHPSPLTEATDVACLPDSPAVAQPDVGQKATPSSHHDVSVGEPFLSAEFTYSRSKSTFTAVLRPLWLLTPSMTHASLLLAGIRQQTRSLSEALRSTRPANTPVLSTHALSWEGAVAVDVRVMAVSVFVVQKEVAISPQVCTSQHVEDAVKRALDCEALLVATEAVVVKWDSELAMQHDAEAAAKPLLTSATLKAQTVAHLRSTSILAMRGLQQCTVLLDRFGISATRQLQDSVGAPAEEWKLSLEPLQLTLTQVHYTALLRLMVQQTSFLASLTSSASAASQTVATATAVTEFNNLNTELLPFSAVTSAAVHGAQQTITAATPHTKSAPRRFRLQIGSLSLRVVQGDEVDEKPASRSGTLTAVYVQLTELDATYVNGGVDFVSGSPLFAVSLRSCLVGTEGAIPTFSLAPPASAAMPTTPSCVLRITESGASRAKSGHVNLRQVTITVEAAPVMAWADLLYAPYLQIVVPNYQAAKEQVMERDLWLSEDLVLTARTPLRVINKSYSLLYLYGNGCTIHLTATRGEQLIYLDEGVTLRITHAIVSMEAESIDVYVSTGNGSYVVLDRETCTVVRPSDTTAQEVHESHVASPRHPQQQLQQMLSGVVWTQFEGDVQVQLRVPEPRNAALTTPLLAGPATSTASNAQRTLVLYSDMRLSLSNANSAVPGVGEMCGSFILAHAGARSEFVNASGAITGTFDLLSDWAMTVQYTEEKCLLHDGDGVEDGVEEGGHVHYGRRRERQPVPRRRVQQLRNVFLDATTGVELRVKYSDIFFVLRAARHAETAVAKWKDVMRRDLWSSLTTWSRCWNADELDGHFVTTSLMHEGSATASAGANSLVVVSPPAADIVTRTALIVQIPFISFVAVDDSQNTDTPLFCLDVNDIRTPNFVVESPHVKAELQFTLQLDYYRLAKSQWAPVLDPLRVNVVLNWRQNTSILDVYNRKGYVRLAVQTSSVRSYLTLELLRNLRQLQLLRAKFEAAGVELFKATEKKDVGRTQESVPLPPSSSPSSFLTYNLLQSTGLALAVRLPEYVSGSLSSGASTTSASAPAVFAAHVVASGESWAFNLPCSQSKELPRTQHKILVQHIAAPVSKTPTTDSPRAAVVSVAAVGVQRVPLHISGPLQRYVVADVSVPPQQQGQKQIDLHSTVLFHNQLSVNVLQLAANERGTYDVIDVVAPGAAQYVSIENFRRRVCLALSQPAAPAPSASAKAPQQRRSYALGPDAVVALGVSYDALPCLVNDTLLCVSAAATTTVDVDVGGGGNGGATTQSANVPQPRLAKGKYFEVYEGKADRSYFLLRMEAAANQPSDVCHFPALAPLRVITVAVEAALTIHNAVGLPLILTLLQRRVRPGARLGLLDTAPDTAVYTALHTTLLKANASYGATELDPLDDVCISAALQQPNGNTLQQWSSQIAGSKGGSGVLGNVTAFYPPACVYCPGERGRRDGQLVLADPTTGATLVLYIKYTKQLVTLYCPHWIVNETQLPLQFADTSSPHAGGSGRCTGPIAGLGGRTVSTATVAPWGNAPQQSNVSSGGAGESTGSTVQVHLYNSLRAESCSKNKANAGTNGLFVRVWEAATSDVGEPACFSDWSQQALSVHEVDDVQVITCASRRTRGVMFVLSCRVELGSHTNLHAYSDTRVIYIRPRWVLMNKSPYALCFSQSLPGGATSGGARCSDVDAALVRVGAFSNATLPVLAAAAANPGGRLNPRLFFAISDDARHNVQRCRWSSSIPINVVHEESTNVVYHSLIPLSEYWPQSSPHASQNGKAEQRIPESLPPLQPEDIKEIDGELFVDREEAKVFTTTAYVYKGCMMCVEIEEAAQPPIVIENRTSYTVCFQQRGVHRVSTVFPRRRKAWTWDVTPSASSTPAVVELWLAKKQETSDGAAPRDKQPVRGSPSPAVAARTLCVLNFDPQQISQQSRSTTGFQQEIEVHDSAHGTPAMLFVRVRGVHGMSYAVSITTEPTIDAYRTLPYPQLSFALQVESVYALLCGEDARSVLLCSIEPLSFTFAQGVRRRQDDANAAGATAAAGDADSGDTDVQRLQLRLSSFQVDDERSAAKERVVAQLVDDGESGFQIERKLLRTTPLLCCSAVAFRLTPIELHIEDSFINAMMSYQELVHSTWNLACSLPTAAPTKRLKRASTVAAYPPWEADLLAALTVARHTYAKAADSMSYPASGGEASHHRGSAAPLWSRVVAIDQLYVDPLLVSLSLYRSPGAVDDPLWKIAGAASLLVGSTQDARLQWDAVQRRRVCDTIWHLFFVHRDAYHEQMKKQYMSLVNVMGLDTVRNFVSDLLNAYSDDPRDRHDGGRGGCGTGNRPPARRQKPRIPLRRSAKFCMDQAKDAHARVVGGGGHTRNGSPSSSDVEAVTESLSATAAWMQQVQERKVQVSAQRTATVADVARTYPWSAFMSVAHPAEVRAFGGVAISRAMAEMTSTPRYSFANGEGGTRRLSAQDVVKSRASATRVQCTRCVELEALRVQRMRDGAATPLPHPTKDGFLTWEEFAHHINWYEFVDMCSDDEVYKYASLVHAGACEASSNVCIITFN